MISPTLKITLKISSFTTSSLSLRLYLPSMSTKGLDPIISLLAPEETLILGHTEDSNPISSGEANLLSAAKTLSKLPDSSWLHLATIESRPVFVLSYPIDQGHIVFLTFPSSTSIRQLEEKLALLRDARGNQAPDPSAGIALELTTDDLKTKHTSQPGQDAFLSIFSELNKSTAQASPTSPNLSDTQPISL